MNLSSELLATTLAASLTGVLWIPIVLDRLTERGLWNALRTPEPGARPRANWAYRLANAHRNAIENLAVFAPLAITVHVLGVSDALTASASLLFLAARLAHAVIYAAGVPVLRTIAFVIGFACQAVLALRILGAA